MGYRARHRPDRHLQPKNGAHLPQGLGQGRRPQLGDQENNTEARLVKVFVRACYERGRFKAANDELAGETSGIMEFMFSMSPQALIGLIDLGLALVLRLGESQAVEGKVTFGQIVALPTTFSPP
jgi:hypothetical protein